MMTAAVGLLLISQIPMELSYSKRNKNSVAPSSLKLGSGLSLWILESD